MARSADNLFYKQVKEEVQRELDARAKLYMIKDRAPSDSITGGVGDYGAFEWTHRKKIYWSVKTDASAFFRQLDASNKKSGNTISSILGPSSISGQILSGNNAPGQGTVLQNNQSSQVESTSEASSTVKSCGPDPNWEFPQSNQGFPSRKLISSETPKYQRLSGPGPVGYEPIPVMKSIEVTLKGKLGYIRECNLSFECFSLEQLEELERNLMTPGLDVTVEWGWTTFAAESSTVKNTFKGIVYDFNWSLTDNGGFDCSVKMKGKADVAMGVPLNVGPTLEFRKGTNAKYKYKDSDGNEQERIPNNIAELLIAESAVVESNALSDLVTFATGITLGSLGADDPVFRISPQYQENLTKGSSLLEKKTSDKYISSYISVPDSVDNSDAWYETFTDIFGDSDSVVVTWTTLENVIDVINEFLVNDLDPQESISFVCNPEITKVLYDEYIFSALPYHIIIPNKFMAASEDFKQAFGASELGSSIFADVLRSVSKDGSWYGGYIGVSLHFLKELMVDVLAPEGESAPPDRSEDDTTVKIDIKTVLEKIFSRINTLTGGWIDLGIIQNPENDKQYLIIDRKYKPELAEQNTIVPYEIPVFSANKGNAVLSLNMSSKIPSGTATSLYVGNRAKGNTASLVSLLPCYQHDQTEDIAEKIKRYEELKDNLVASAGRSLRMGDREFNVAQNRLNEYTRTPDPSKSPKDTRRDSNVPYPLELSFDVEGITGFEYGDIVTTNYVPSKYLAKTKGGKRNKLVFMVKNITHKIDGTQWVTSIDTQCRMNHDGA